MDKLSGFQNLIPILKNKDMLPLLYDLKSPASLDEFLKKHNVSLSPEEVEKLWDLIDVCKPYNNEGSEKSHKSDSSKKDSAPDAIPDKDIDISGGVDIFSDKVNTLLGLIS